MKFSELPIHPDLIRATQEMGFTELTSIQEKCLQPGLDGRDIAGVSQTGTGKTLAFLLPILHSIFSEPSGGDLAALIVSPTRELCLQIAEEAERLCRFHPALVVAIYGGEDYKKQERALSQNPEIIVATPGRLIDYMKQGKVDTSALRYLVLDEADRMLDMGFIKDVRYIMRHVPESANTFLFSATLSYYIMRLASDFMNDPVEVRIESESVAVEKIDQHLLHLSRDEKDAYLLNQLLDLKNPRAIVFTNYRHAVTRIVRRLQKYGIAATGISSLLDQKKRVKLLKGFKTGRYSVLVATDVASRGLDVEDISHIFNYDLPGDAESYVHRIGRTARAGKSGVSFAYCCEDDYENLPRIQRYMDMKIPVAEPRLEWLRFPQGDFRPFRDKNASKAPSKAHSKKQGHKKEWQRSEKKGPRKKRSAFKQARSRNFSGKEKGRPEKEEAIGNPQTALDKNTRKSAASQSKARRPKQDKNRASRSTKTKNAKMERRTIRAAQLRKTKEKKGIVSKIKSLFSR